MSCKAEFKETEVGLIPKGWSVVEVSDFVDIKHGYAFKGKFFTDEENENVILTPGNFHIGGGFKDDKFKFTTEDYPLDYILKKGDIVVTMTDLSKKGDTLGYAAKIPGSNKKKYLHNQRLGLLQFKSNAINRDFLHWALRTKRYNWFVVGSATGSTVKHTSPSRIKLYKFACPTDLKEQQAIAYTLSSLDDKIELNRRMNATLEQIAQTIFKQWFIDFEFPDERGQPYKSSGGEMVESELGEIPRGWEVKDIGDICKTFGGGTPKTKEPSYWEDGDIFWATPTDMTSLKSPIIFDTSRKITEEGLNKSSAKLLPIGSVLMTSRATLGYFAITKVPICTNQGFISMVCDGEVSNYYLLHTLKNKVELIENLASGSTYLEINKSSFRSISVIIPPSSLIEKFDNFVKLIYDKIYLYESESQNLSLIRDELLPKLMSGKIRLL
jgi:type I restriction enzyme S subunit